MKLLRTLFVASSVLALSAATLSAQAAQQVTCKDGAKSKGGRGACSGHGGIAAAAKAEVKADTKVAKTDAKADVKAAKTDAKADVKVAKTDAKADVKAAKTDAKADVKVAGAPMAETKVAKHSKKKAKAKA